MATYFGYNIDEIYFIIDNTTSSYSSANEHILKVINIINIFDHHRKKSGKIYDRIPPNHMPFYLYDFFSMKIMKTIKKKFSSFVTQLFSRDRKTFLIIKLINNPNRISEVCISINSHDSYNWTIDLTKRKFEIKFLDEIKDELPGYPKEFFSTKELENIFRSIYN